MAPTDLPQGLQAQPLEPLHAEALVPLVVEAGWNQIAADWRFMLQAGRGVGVRDEQGDWIGSALSFALGPQLAWISMVLTAERWRRRGIGNALLARAITEARAGGGAVGLDATEFGRPVYLKSGFRDLYGIRRWRIATRPPAAPPPGGVDIVPVEAADLPALIAYDARHSAMQRGHVLQHLQGRAPVLALMARSGGRPVGYALGRDGRVATQIGPVLADDPAIARALIGRAMNEIGSPWLIDVPEAHDTLAAWLGEADAHTPRGYMRMVLGEAPGLEDCRQIFALAGPELG